MFKVAVLLASNFATEWASVLQAKIPNLLPVQTFDEALKAIDNSIQVAFIEDDFGGPNQGIVLMRAIREAKGDTVRVVMIAHKKHAYYQIFDDHYLNEQLSERVDEIITLPATPNEFYYQIEVVESTL